MWAAALAILCRLSNFNLAQFSITLHYQIDINPRTLTTTTKRFRSVIIQGWLTQAQFSITLHYQIDINPRTLTTTTKRFRSVIIRGWLTQAQFSITLHYQILGYIGVWCLVGFFHNRISGSYMYPTFLRATPLHHPCIEQQTLDEKKSKHAK
jgi:hypothetical protein